jgi:hypothetical protein
MRGQPAAQTQGVPTSAVNTGAATTWPHSGARSGKTRRNNRLICVPRTAHYPDRKQPK